MMQPVERNVRLALGDLKERLEKAKADPLQHSLIVSVVELETLLVYAEDKAALAEKEAERQHWALTCELVEGDEVLVSEDMGFIAKGTEGLLFEIVEYASFPYVVRFKNGRVYIFTREELKRKR